MNAYANTGKIFHTIAAYANDPDVYKDSWSVVKHLFGGTPNPDAIFKMPVDGEFFFRYSIESVGVRDYLRNIFLENSQQAADGINTMIRYRQSVGDEAMKSIIYSIKNTDRPFDGPDRALNSKAHQIGKQLPAISGEEFKSFTKFLEPSLKEVTSGHNRNNGRRSPSFIYGALPFMWALELVETASQGSNQSWDVQRNCNPKWFWMASAFEFMKSIGHRDYITTERFGYLNCGAYVLGDYFKNLGLENATAHDVKQFGYKLLRSYDYASTAKTLLLIKESTNRSYFQADDIKKIKLTYEDILDVLEYGKRLEDNVAKSGRAAVQAEKDLAELVRDRRVQDFVKQYAEKNCYYAYTCSSINTLETTADNEFALREETSPFVRKAVHDGLMQSLDCPIPERPPERGFFGRLFG